MELNFRPLKANEIECRVQTCGKNYVSLLLYKDARVDQRLLDETVGPMNWQRHHSRDNANCIVAIWDNSKSMWIEKEDVGTESNTEAVKGLASDSFKRACFNWGLGRELYSAPDIWVNDVTTYENGTNKHNQPIYATKDRFEVSAIGYDQNREINYLVIRNKKTKKVVFALGNQTAAEQPKTEPKAEPKAEQAAEQTIGASKIDAIKVKALTEACISHGVPTEKIMKLYKVNALSELTETKFSHINQHWEQIKKA